MPAAKVADTKGASSTQWCRHGVAAPLTEDSRSRDKIPSSNAFLIIETSSENKGAPASGEKLGLGAAYGDSYQFETTETLPVGYALLFDAAICVTNQRLFPRFKLPTDRGWKNFKTLIACSGISELRSESFYQKTRAHALRQQRGGRTNFKLIGAAVILSMIATPVFAQAAIESRVRSHPTVPTRMF